MKEDKEKKPKVIELDLILTREELIESLKSEWDENNKLREQIHLLEVANKEANGFKEQMGKQFDDSIKTLTDLVADLRSQIKVRNEELKEKEEIISRMSNHIHIKVQSEILKDEEIKRLKEENDKMKTYFQSIPFFNDDEN